jgi:hypothetical protein
MRRTVEEEGRDGSEGLFVLFRLALSAAACLERELNRNGV